MTETPAGSLPRWDKAAFPARARLSRARTLSASARLLLAMLAVVAAETPEELCRALVGPRAEGALAELSAAGLVVRRGGSPKAAYALADSVLAPALADALAGFEVVDRVATVLLDRPAARAETLLAVACAPHPPSRRTELLRRACERAEVEGLRSVQIEALLALAADPKERSATVLSALDRLTRGGGSAGMHPEVVGWLEEAAECSPPLRVLALRRRAEQSARAGKTDEAKRLGSLALEAAEAQGDPAAVALAHSTIGALALYRADWATADAELAASARHVRFGQSGRRGGDRSPSAQSRSGCALPRAPGRSARCVRTVACHQTRARRSRRVSGRAC